VELAVITACDKPQNLNLIRRGEKKFVKYSWQIGARQQGQ
jgi:hypothetical protein